MNETTQQEKTTQLGSRNETTQLVSRHETTQLNRRKQLNSSVGTKQLNSALPSTAYNRLQPPATAYNHLQPPATAYNHLQPPATASTAYNRLQPPAPPATACNRLHRLYSRIGFFYLLQCTEEIVLRKDVYLRQEKLMLWLSKTFIKTEGTLEIKVVYRSFSIEV
ncbi:hypothetical protein TNCV_4334151 [Trichonephila clavipes]|nr:hypothetical protein TNCV_4334151 [Trichonephila clavipes]